MVTLSEVGLGDVEVASYRELRPGRKVYLWYADDTVWHENMVAFLVGGDEVVLWTPDDDLYIESIGCKGISGPSRLRGVGVRGGVPHSVRGQVYRFRTPPTDDQIKKIVREAHALVERERGTAVTPTEIVDSMNRVVDIDAFFGGSFVRRRMTGKGVLAGDSAGGTPDSPKHAHRVRPATADTVWVASEPLGGLALGQEVSLNLEDDVQVGDRTAMALRRGTWVKVELIPVSDAAGYAEARRQLFEATAPKNPEESLTEKPLVVKKEADAKPEAMKSDGDDPPEHGDVRTLYVDTDEHGERFKRWRDVCSESFTPTFDSKPLEGPCTALHLIKHTERQGGDPRLWLQLWLRSKHIEATDRTYHEMKVSVDVLFYAGTFDQVNIPGLISLEVVCRRLQAIVDAYTNASKPSWENAKLFTGQGAPEDIIAPVFRTYAAKKNKEELELLQARQRVRELRGSPAVALEDPTGDAIIALPKRTPKAKAGKGKGRADDGQGDA